MLSSPLALDAWLQFNELTSGLRTHRMHFGDNFPAPPAVEAILFLDKRGRVSLPPRHPYLLIELQTASDSSSHRAASQWLQLADLLIEDMSRRGLSHTKLALPPEIGDARVWQWAKLSVDVRYTFYIDFPYQLEQANQSVRRSIKKAIKQGYTCVASSNLDDVWSCLVESEERQQFRIGLSLDDVRLGARLLGAEHFRTYVCYSGDGEPASACIILHRAGGRGLYWMAGTKTAHLHAGATQLMISHLLADLQANGADGFDFFGANIRSVAEAKSAWGARLVPYYTIEEHTLRSVAKQVWQGRHKLRRGR